ncbi:MAG: hypothetical protein ACQESF_04700 [Nanobdellota archaeon]
MKSKRGYFFAIDAVIALSILTLGTVLAISYFGHQVSEDQVMLISDNIMSFMYSHNIKDLNSDYIGPNRELHRNKNITDLDNPLIMQLGEFYYRGEEKGCTFCKSLIKKSLQNVSGEFLAKGYSFTLYIEEELLYNKTKTNKEDSTMLVPAKTIISGVYNENELWGPYTIEVRAWR